MKKIAYFLITLFVFSCTSNTIYKKPEDLIPRDSMVLLLKDMYIATAARHVKNKFSQKKKNYMPLVYEKYKIDSLRFETSNNFYTSNVETYNEMVSDVKDKLKKELGLYEGKIKTQDSIKKVVRKNDSIIAAETKAKIRDSIAVKEKITELEKVKASMVKKPKDSIKLQEKIVKIEALIDSINNSTENRKLLKNQGIEIEKLRDSIRNTPKDSTFLKGKIVEIEKIMDSIRAVNVDSTLLKEKASKIKKAKDSVKKKTKKDLKNAERLLRIKDEGYQRE